MLLFGSLICLNTICDFIEDPIRHYKAAPSQRSGTLMVIKLLAEQVNKKMNTLAATSQPKARQLMSQRISVCLSVKWVMEIGRAHV